MSDWQKMLEYMKMVRSYCEHQMNCDKCMFNLKGRKDKLRWDDCVFCGTVDIDSNPPCTWQLEQLYEILKEMESKHEEEKNS